MTEPIESLRSGACSLDYGWEQDERRAAADIGWDEAAQIARDNLATYQQIQRERDQAGPDHPRDT